VFALGDAGMNGTKGGVHAPKISWTSIVTVLLLGGALAITIASAGWTIFQAEFNNVEKIANADRDRSAAATVELKAIFDKYLTKETHNAYVSDVKNQIDTIKERVATIQRIQDERGAKIAHDPVEQKTVDAINSAIDKRIDLIQSQITDINRQIAAALIIIDNNAVSTSSRRSPATLPP
jgi:hypothetical protein